VAEVGVAHIIVGPEALAALEVGVQVDHFQLVYQLLALPIQVEEAGGQLQYKM
jgi:hypothetical protein